MVDPELGGMTLAQRLARGPLEPEKALNILEQLLPSLEASHDLGLVHGSISPQKIVLTPDGKATLIDFPGRDPGAQPMPRFGRGAAEPGYVAPEQIADDPVDRRADLYSLGVVAYAMLTGKDPFGQSEGVAADDVYYRIVYKSVPPVPKAVLAGLPASVGPAIDRAMSKEPQARFEDAGIFLQSLRADSALVPAPAPPDPKQVKREEERRRREEEQQLLAEEKKKRDAEKLAAVALLAEKRRQEELEKQTSAALQQEEKERVRREAEQARFDEEQRKRDEVQQKREEEQRRLAEEKKKRDAEKLAAALLVSEKRGREELEKQRLVALQQEEKERVSREAEQRRLDEEERKREAAQRKREAEERRLAEEKKKRDAEKLAAAVLVAEKRSQKELEKQRLAALKQAEKERERRKKAAAGMGGAAAASEGRGWSRKTLALVAGVLVLLVAIGLGAGYAIGAIGGSTETTIADIVTSSTQIAAVDDSTTTSTTEPVTTTVAAVDDSTTTTVATTTTTVPPTTTTLAPSSTTTTAKTTTTTAKPTTTTTVRTSISGASIAVIPAQTYAHAAFTPSPTVTYGGKTLIKGTDYTVAYSKNTNAGTASVTITGKGKYTGSKSTSFTINKADPASISVSGWTGDYDGSSHGAVLHYAHGVSGEDLSGSVSLGQRYTDVGNDMPAHWTMTNSNYNPREGTVYITINAVTPSS
jgi:hypothetical protein